MANKVTIDVEARFIDNVTDEARAAAKSFDTLEKAAEGTQKDLKELGKTKVKPKVDLDANSAAKKLDAMDKKLNKFRKSKTEAKLSVLDKATAVIDKVTSKAKAFGSKTYSGLLKIRDSNVLGTLNKMSNGLKSLTSKAWSVVVKIKDTFTAPLKKLKDSLFNIKNLVTGIATAWAVKWASSQLIGVPVSLADQYTSAKIGFSTLLGESRGQAMMNEIDSFAAATPFKTSNVISNVQKMMAYGWDPEKVIDDMKIIGDAAAATGKGDEGLGSIVYALSEIRSKGKLSTQELNQLASAGIKAKQYLAQGLGYGTGDEGLKKLSADLQKGAIGANQAVELILEGMKEFDGMMDKTANETIKGLKDQLSDLFEINVTRRWGQGLQDGLKRGLGSIVSLIDGAGDALGRLGDLAYEVGKIASNWLADKLEDVIRKITEITDTFEFQNADLAGKISMLWKGIVADPLQEWWEGGGREKTIETAKDIGTTIGKAIFEAISVAWSALPWWGKLLVGGYGAGKLAGGIANFAGGIANFAGGVKKFLGSSGTMGPGNVITGASGLLGLIGKTGQLGGVGSSGILGGLAKTGWTLVGGTSALSMTGGTAALLGGAGIAGGVAGGASLIKGGVDLYGAYKASKEGDALEARAKSASGVGAVGGVATGAALGAAIGSVVPVLGTAVGALIGAGVGGIAGWLGGDAIANKIRETDDAINDVTAATEKLETEEEKLAQKAKMVWQNMKDHFGDIKLSTSEIAALTKQIVWGDDLESYEQFNSAVQNAAANLKTLKSASEATNKWMWKASLGVKFNKDEKESIAASFNDFITSAITYAENKHYEFTAAVSLLVGAGSGEGKSILASGNAFYTKLQGELNDLGEDLSDKVQIAIKDGIITLDEHDEIINLQNQIAEITKKLSDAETEAELELIKVKFGSGNLDKDSFDTFMAQMGTTLNERIAASDKALTASISSLKLQLEEGAISQEEYDKQLQALTDGYTANVESIKARILNVEMDIIADAYKGDLGMDAAQKLQTALELSIASGLDPINWTVDQARHFLNTPGLSESSAGALSQVLSAIISQLGNDLQSLGVDATVGVNVQGKPTVAKIILGAKDFGVQNSYRFEPLVNLQAKLGTVTPIKLPTSQLTTGGGFRGGIFGGSFARGGMPDNSGIVGGSTRFIRVNEESPEMIIPLSDQRRGRALKLWAQAGNIMGVPGFARGGIVGGNGSDEGIRFNTYGSDNSASGRSVQVNVGGVKLEINVNGSDRESIVEAIKAQAGDLADYIAGVIAESLEAEFENTPVRGGVA